MTIYHSSVIRRVDTETGELLPITDKELIDDIFGIYRSRNISNLTATIESISELYDPALTPDILNDLRDRGKLKNIANVSQVHFERL